MGPAFLRARDRHPQGPRRIAGSVADRARCRRRHAPGPFANPLIPSYSLTNTAGLFPFTALDFRDAGAHFGAFVVGETIDFIVSGIVQDSACKRVLFVVGQVAQCVDCFFDFVGHAGSIRQAWMFAT